MQIDGPANIPAEDDGSTIDLDALRAEVSKWQERVPKLAKALRERTEELAAAREELRAAQTSPARESISSEDTDARLQTRNALIAELQEKVTELGEKHRQLSGTLHTTNLDLESAREKEVPVQPRPMDRLVPRSGRRRRGRGIFYLAALAGEGPGAQDRPGGTGPG